jgi:hypothetical protein
MIKDCVFCKNCSYDPDFLTVSTSTTRPIVGGALFCEQVILKDIFYNTVSGKRKKGKEMVNADEEPPVLVGKVVWVCKGQYFEDTGESVLGNPITIESGTDAKETGNEFEGFTEEFV